MGVAGAAGRAAHRHARTSSCPNGVKVAEGTAVMVSYGAANVDPAEFPRRLRRALRPRDRTATSRSAAVCTGASVRTSHVASCASRCASGTGASPTTASSPATRSSSTRRACAHVKDLTLVWPRS